MAKQMKEDYLKMQREKKTVYTRPSEDNEDEVFSTETEDTSSSVDEVSQVKFVHLSNCILIL
jgi:hypothetical protein